MSEFVMGARLELTDNFSGQMSTATRATEQFIRTADTVNQTVTSFSSAMGGTVQPSQAFADNLQGVSTAADAANQDTAAFSSTVGNAEQATQTYVGSLQDVATAVSGTDQATQTFADNLQGVAAAAENIETPITQASNSTRGFLNGIRSLTGGVKSFAQTKLTSIVDKFTQFKTRVTGGETGVKGLWNATKNLAKTSLSALHTGISKIGSLAVSAGSKLASGLGSAISGAAKGLSVGVGVAGAAMAGLTVKAINLEGELEQNLGGSEAVFKEFSATMQETGKTAFSSMGLSQSDFLATANKMGALFQGAGFGIEQSADLSASAMQRSADVASIMGIDVETAMEAVAGAAKGNFTMMDNLGVAMNDTAIGAYALEKGIKTSTAEMTQQEKIGLAMEMFMDKTAYAAGNYAKENDTLAGSLTTAKSAMSNFLAGSGDVDALVTSFMNVSNIVIDMVSETVPRLATGVTDAISAILPKIPELFTSTLPILLNAATQMVQSIIETVKQNTQPLVGLAVTVITSLAEFLLDAIPQIILVGVDILLGFVQGITAQLPQLITTGMSAINTLINGVLSRLPMIIQAALTLIQTLVGGLIANLPMIIQSGITLLISLVQGVMGMLPSLLQMALQLIMAIAQGLIANLPLILNAAVQVVVSLVQGIVTMLPMIIQSAIQLIITLFQGIIANLPMILQAAVQIIVALAVGLIQAIPQLIAAIPQLISAIVDTIMNTNWLQVGWDIVKGIGKGLFDGIKGLFGGGGEEGGAAIAEGTATGLNSNVGSITSASQTTADAITTGLQPDFTAINGYGATATSGLATGLATGAETLNTTATTMGTDAMTNLSTSFTAATPIAVTAATQTGTATVTGLSTGITDGMGLATNASTSVTTGVTDTFNSIDLHGAGTNAMQGFIDGMNAMRSSIMDVANGIANSVKTTINSALDIHSPSRVLEESGEFAGEGLVLGIMKMVDRVKAAAQGLSDSTVEPFATHSTTAGAISPSGITQAQPGKREGLKIAIENIILQNVGDKDPKELVAEILKLLYTELSGADEVLSAGEMGALLI